MGCQRITPGSHKASHHKLEFLNASVKVFILERNCTLAAVTNELCIIAKPSKGSRMLVSAVDTDNRDRRVIKASFPHGRDPDSEAISMPESSASPRPLTNFSPALWFEVHEVVAELLETSLQKAA